MSVGTKVVWIHNLMGELIFLFMEFTIWHCYNQIMIPVVANLVAQSVMVNMCNFMHTIENNWCRRMWCLLSTT